MSAPNAHVGTVLGGDVYHRRLRVEPRLNVEGEQQGHARRRGTERRQSTEVDKVGKSQLRRKPAVLGKGNIDTAIASRWQCRLIGRIFRDSRHFVVHVSSACPAPPSNNNPTTICI